MYSGENNQGMVVHPNWFTITKEDTVTHRGNCWDYLLPTLYMSIQLYKLGFIQYINNEEFNSESKSLVLHAETHKGLDIHGFI